MPIIVAITAVIVGAGMYTTTGVFGTNSLLNTEGTSVNESPGLTGHVTLVASDSQGNIKAYRQTDNLIFNGGANCIGKLVFGSNGTSGGNPTGCATYHYVAVGSNSTAIAVTDRDFGSFLTELGSTSRTDASGTNLGLNNSTNTGAGGAAVSVIGGTVNIGSSGTVNTVGLANSATSSAGDLFSRVKLGTGISVNSGDTIKVSWYISISH